MIYKNSSFSTGPWICLSERATCWKWSADWVCSFVKWGSWTSCWLGKKVVWARPVLPEVGDHCGSSALFTCDLTESLSFCPWRACPKEVISKAYHWLYISFHQVLSSFHVAAGGLWDKSGKVPCALLSGGWSIFDLETGDKSVFCQVRLAGTFLFSGLLLTAVFMFRMVIG